MKDVLGCGFPPFLVPSVETVTRWPIVVFSLVAIEPSKTTEVRNVLGNPLSLRSYFAPSGRCDEKTWLTLKEFLIVSQVRFERLLVTWSHL